MPTFVYSNLQHAAFLGTSHPEVLVHVPERFDPQRFGVVTYLHGFENCIENVAAAAPGIHEPPQPTANLIAQLESVNKSAILFLPELGYHVRSAEAGQVGERGGFARLFREVLLRLQQDLPAFAAVSVDVAPHLLLISHSGGYKAAALIAEHGGLKVAELCLLDSLYGALDSYDALLVELLSAPAGQTQRRFINLYNVENTGKHSHALGERLREKLAKESRSELLYFDDGEAGLEGGTLDAALSHLIAVKRVPTEHSNFGATYVAPILRTSFLPD